jgi:hypothetical protein
MATVSARFAEPIYARGVVEEAVEAFEDFGSFQVEARDGAVVVTAEIEDNSLRRIWGEFQNYILINT